MKRDEWLNQKANKYFKNKEFFPNLTEEDLDEIMHREDSFANITHKSIGGSSNGIFKDIKTGFNFDALKETALFFRTYLNTPVKITSGFRSMRKHLQIYRNIAKRKGKEFDMDKVPTNSAHLSLRAFDFVTKDTKKSKSDIYKCYYVPRFKTDYLHRFGDVNCDFHLMHDLCTDEFKDLFPLDKAKETLSHFYFEHFSKTCRKDDSGHWIHIQLREASRRFFYP